MFPLARKTAVTKQVDDKTRLALQRRYTGPLGYNPATTWTSSGKSPDARWWPLVLATRTGLASYVFDVWRGGGFPDMARTGRVESSERGGDGAEPRRKTFSPCGTGWRVTFRALAPFAFWSVGGMQGTRASLGMCTSDVPVPIAPVSATVRVDGGRGRGEEGEGRRAGRRRRRSAGGGEASM